MRKTKRKPPQPRKRLMWRQKYAGEINSVIYKKRKVLKVVVLLGCGLPPWMGLGYCPVMFSWLGELVSEFRLMELDLFSLKGSAVSSNRFRGVYEFSMSLGNPSGFGSVRHFYFHSHVKVALSAYIICRQSSICPWNLCKCFCSLVPPCTTDQSLLGRGLWGSFLSSSTTPSGPQRLVWASASPWGCPLCHGAVCTCLSSPGHPVLSQGLCALILTH